MLNKQVLQVIAYDMSLILSRCPYFSLVPKKTKPCVWYEQLVQLRSFGFAISGHWFNLQWGRSRYTLLMKPNAVKTAVQFSVCHA